MILLLLLLLLLLFIIIVIVRGYGRTVGTVRARQTKLFADTISLWGIGSVGAAFVSKQDKRRVGHCCWQLAMDIGACRHGMDWVLWQKMRNRSAETAIGR